ncbi:MAG: hypothetical protein H7146_05230 [Burkholderiaceae bacterium]|nr:hypothetical protein [Microbacteriaceae bacterium]
MRGKLILVAGLAVGYVLGSRAGRGRYDQIARAADTFWHSGSVQRQVHAAEDFAKDKAPDVVDFVTGKVTKAVRTSSAKKSAARSRARDSATPSPSN